MLVVIALLSLVLLCFASWHPEGQVLPTPLAIDYPSYFGHRISRPPANPTTVEGVRLGRMLFYEPALSASGKVSCASCHKQQFAFADDRRFSAGVDGTLLSRNTMSLANLLWVRQFFWDGRTRGLEAQAKEPLTHPHEMGQALAISVRKLEQSELYPAYFRAAFGIDRIVGDHVLNALAQFQRTLVSAGSLYDHYLRGGYVPSDSENRGMALFFNAPGGQPRGAGCAHCHGGPQTYQELFHNNGLDAFPPDSGRKAVTGQEYDNGRFRVTTLRNIALTAPYMHDGRFQTLKEVVDHYSEGVANSQTLSPFLKDRDGKPTRLRLSSQEKIDLLAFLQLLTDSTFITDERHSNPFKN